MDYSGGGRRRGSPNSPYGGGRGRQRSRSPPFDRERRPSPSSYGSKRFRRDDDYRGGRGGRGRPHYGGDRRQTPMTFREFMAGLRNDASPEYAKSEYDRYLAEFYGNETKAEFERKKNDPALRQRYDPREIKVCMEKKRDSVKAAARFVAEKGIPSGRKIPLGPYAYVAIGDDVDLSDDGKPEDFRMAFPVTNDRRAQYMDFKTARRLIRKLDSEVGVEGNTLLPPGDEEDTVVVAEEQEEEEKKKDEEGEPMEQDNTVEGDKEQMEVEEKGQEEDEEAALAKYAVDDDSFDVKQLDDLMQYLWIVHGVDYYGCKEYGFEQDYLRKVAKRIMRPQELQAEGESKEQEPYKASLRDLNIHETKICKRWANRISQGSPVMKMIKDEKVEQELEKFIDSQIVKHEENKWGNKLSNKLFVAREFVVKHIKNKHAHVLDAEKERILDTIYRENYLSVKDRETKRGGGGRGGGRGGRHGRGGGRNQMMYIDPSMMGGQLLMSSGGRGGVTPVMLMPVGGGRGGRGGRGRGYFDLDAPQNNRSMLDYGDL